MLALPGTYRTGISQAVIADLMEEKVLPLLIRQPNHRSWQLLASEATKTHSQGLASFFWNLHLKLQKSVTRGWPAGTSWETHPWLLLRSLASLPSDASSRVPTCEFRECLLMTGLRVSSVLLPGIFFFFLVWSSWTRRENYFLPLERHLVDNPSGIP